MRSLCVTVFCTAQTNTGALVIGAWGITTDIKLERVAVRNCGGAGISVGNNVQRLEILDSAVLSVGASGIQFAGTNVTDRINATTMPIAVKMPKVRMGWMSITTKLNSPSAVVSPAVSTVGPVRSTVFRTASAHDSSRAWAWYLDNMWMA